MTSEYLTGIGMVVGVMFTTWLWLKRTTSALDAIPGLVQRVEDALKVADQALLASKAAHARLDAHALATGDRINAHGERLARMEVRLDTHDRDSDRRDEELTARLDRFEASLGHFDQKLDRLMERRTGA